MNTKNLIKLFVLVFALYFILPGCSKKSDTDTASNKTTQTGKENTDENSLQESDEDLASVDYKVFYDELSSKGEWVEVDAKELGFIGGSTDYASDLDNKESFLSKVFGVKTANAETKVDVDAFFVWKPAPDLAVALTTGDQPQPVYTPYVNGQWVNTDAGWYFKAPTPAEEITSHYGRWTYNENLGYVWVPGRVWAPAWVDWRVNDNYVAWTPIPPYTYIVNDVVNVPVIEDDRYVIVEQKSFIEPQIYKYMYLENKNKVMIKDMRKVNGVMVVNRTVVNKGPDVSIIETMLGKPIEKVTINRVDNRDDVKYTSNTYTVYAPKLKKVKTDKSNMPVSKPPKVVKFNEVTTSAKEMNKKEEKQMEKEMKKESKENEKEIKKESKEKEKEIKKENKGQEKGNEKYKGPEKKKGDDSEMKNGKDKGNDNKGNDKKDNGNKNKGKK